MANTFLNPIASKLPMKPFVAPGANAKEYPQKYHWSVMTEKDAIQAKIMERADFLRAKPEYRKPRPGTMRSTMADATMMYEVSPGLNHWLTLMTAGRRKMSAF